MPGGYYCRAAGITADRRVAMNEYGGFDLATGKPIVEYDFGKGIKTCAVHPDGKRIVVFTNGKVRVVPVILGPEDRW